RQRIAVLVVPADLGMEILPADDVGLADLFRRIAHDRDDAVIDGKAVRGNTELLGRAAQQHASCFRPGLAQRRAAEAHTRAPGGTALIHSEPRIALNHANALYRYVELIGDDLCNRKVGALPAVDLAEIDRYRSVAGNCQP